jgi:hypothetical protein
MTLKIKVVGDVDTSPLLSQGYEIVEERPDLIVMEYSGSALRKASKISECPVYMLSKKYNLKEAMDSMSIGCAGYGDVENFSPEYLSNYVKINLMLKTTEKLLRVC